MKKTYLLIYFLVLFASGCENKENDLEVGIIKGVAQLYNIDDKLESDHYGIEVTIEGTSHSCLTGSSGMYELRNIPYGTYNISYKKSGYSTYRKFDYEFKKENDPNLKKVSLYEKPQVVISNISIVSEPGAQIEIQGSIPETTEYCGVLFHSSRTSVSSNNYGDCLVFQYWGEATNLFQQSFNLAYFSYAPGQTIYVVIYLCNCHTITYYDPVISEYSYENAVKASETIEVTIQ
ncbi:MAG: carboxypeptidase regulatory-like domain-containing protein [Bacteroidales bacterium]|nr:carboxypeptidase regulatory-like domain-containing protein [Bacteroidales bacterium]